MKKMLLLIGCAILGFTTAQAQCTPDAQYTEAGIYPDSATNFLPACVGEPYVQLVTNVVPADTTITQPPIPIPITLNINSIGLDSVSGLPPGMTLACSPNSCVFDGGTTGCAVISGTCNVPGTYNLIFYLKADIETVGEQFFELDYYKIVVADCGGVGIAENKSNLFTVYPNPTQSFVTLKGLESGLGIENISVHNAAGQLVQSVQWNGLVNQDINMGEYVNGIYFVSIKHQGGTEVLKLIKE